MTPSSPSLPAVGEGVAEKDRTIAGGSRGQVISAPAAPVGAGRGAQV